LASFDVHMHAVVTVTINDEDAITRVIENHDDQGTPQPLGSGTGWQDHLYPLRTRDEVLEHLAYNALANGVGDAARLDGWADMPRDVTTMRVDYANLEWVDVN
jgi:hypothetical protein